MIKSILFVGDSVYPMYVDAFYKAAKKNMQLKVGLLNHEGIDAEQCKNSLLKRIEQRFAIGYHAFMINRNLVKIVQKERYDAVFLYSERYIRKRTILKLKKAGTLISAYCNDDPFGTYMPKYYWRNICASIPHCDCFYVYRKKNIRDAQMFRARRVKLLLPYYNEDRNYYISDNNISIDVPDVVFLGHMEDDERKEYIEALACENVKVGVKRSSWENRINSNNIVLLEETEKNYNIILNKAKIGIVFLSKINSDTYTRRCFEIPVVKTMMLAPYTTDLAAMFDEDKEIVFYRNLPEFVKKVKYYLKNEEERRRIADAGYVRVLKDGHEALDRVKQIVSDFNDIERKVI